MMSLLFNVGELTPGFEQGLLLGVFKFFLIVGAILYAFFSFIVVRQIAIMRKTLITEFSPIFTILGYVHFALALFVVFFFFTTL